MNNNQLDQSARRRTTTLGRWLPVFFYCLIIIPWFITAVTIKAGDRLGLFVLTLPALVAYVVHVART